MKKVLSIIILFSTVSILAEDINVNVNNTPVKIAKKYEINEGSEDIVGDKSTLRKGAEQNWKNSCNEWRSEFKATNKNNTIISYSCGKMDCSKDGVETTCTSKAKYKVKTLTEEP